MKKVISIVLSLVMLLSMSVTAFASDTGTTETQLTVVQDGYSFSITEKITAEYAVVRTFYNDDSSTRSATDLNKTKALLISLGMKEKAVSKLTTETLQDFADSSYIVVSTSYTKFDEEAGVSTAVSKTTALAEASAIQAAKESAFIQNAQNALTRGLKDNESDVPGEFIDSYMEITHAAAYQGEGLYLFTVDATWLTMPFFRGYDSIGSCAMNGTVTPNTRSGYYSYDTLMVDSLGRITRSSTGDLNITNKQNDTNGNWYGSAGIVNLPNDAASEYSSIMHSNFEAHYQYKGHVNYPELMSWFNSVGTYDHATIGISFSPSVSIEVGGNVSASIGLNIFASVDSRPAEIEINHIP